MGSNLSFSHIVSQGKEELWSPGNLLPVAQIIDTLGRTHLKRQGMSQEVKTMAGNACLEDFEAPTHTARST